MSKYNTILYCWDCGSEDIIDIPMDAITGSKHACNNCGSVNIMEEMSIEPINSSSKNKKTRFDIIDI